MIEHSKRHHPLRFCDVEENYVNHEDKCKTAIKLLHSRTWLWVGQFWGPSKYSWQATRTGSNSSSVLPNPDQVLTSGSRGWTYWIWQHKISWPAKGSRLLRRGPVFLASVLCTCFHKILPLNQQLNAGELQEYLTGYQKGQSIVCHPMEGWAQKFFRGHTNMTVSQYMSSSIHLPRWLTIVDYLNL